MYPAWSPDGSHIAFAGVERLADDRLGPPKVYVIRPDGTGQEQVSREGAGDGTGALPQWSPDGRMLLYSVDLAAPRGPQDPLPDAPPARLELVTAERGSNGWTERVVVGPSNVLVSTFSNDGSRIAFLRSRPDFESDVYVVGVDGTGERMVSGGLVHFSVAVLEPRRPDDHGSHRPHPAGGAVAGLNGWPDQVYEPATGRRRRAVEIPAGAVAGIFSCSWQRLAP